MSFCIYEKICMKKTCRKTVSEISILLLKFILHYKKHESHLFNNKKIYCNEN